MSGELHVPGGSWHICPACGKKKFISSPGEWAYRRNVQGKYHSQTKLFCSWSCLRKWERDHPSPKRKYARPDA